MLAPIFAVIASGWPFVAIISADISILGFVPSPIGTIVAIA